MLPDDLFHRMFQMTKETFAKLCNEIESAVGEESFKSEAYLQSNGWSSGHARTRHANDYKGGVVPGEIKVAIIVIYCIDKSVVYNSFLEVIGWINDTFFFPLVYALQIKDITFFESISNGFAYFTSGIFKGCIGAMDGIAIRIYCPSMSDVPDPVNYWCRKGFYALNVQAICDSSKRILWVSTGHKGSTHDSTAFFETSLYDLLWECADWLFSNGLFLIGDSAYALLSFFLIPFESNVTTPGSPQDGFNFWHSNSCIHVECAFGEIIVRWGIFWRPLRFKLSHCGDIINAALLLHNFLVTERDTGSDDNYFKNFSMASVEENDAQLGDQFLPIVLETESQRSAGRPTTQQQESKSKGRNMQNALMLELSAHGKTRPSRSGTCYNALGHVYLDY
jgi:hypothetical protein